MVPPPLHVWVREVGPGRGKGLTTETEQEPEQKLGGQLRCALTSASQGSQLQGGWLCDLAFSSRLFRVCVVLAEWATVL